MKKNILILLSSTLLLFASCNDQLDEINENPNATPVPYPAFLLTGTLKQGADLYWGSSTNLNTDLLFVQHWASIQYTETDRFDIANTSDNMTSLWNVGYATLIKDLNTILQLDDVTANSNYKGVALVLRSWVFQLLTDAYGDIPYKQALVSFTPAYDTQRDVYLGLLEDLTEAQSLLTSNGGTIEGDVVYKGNINAWKRFANSLKLRIALRIADREPELSKRTIVALAADSTGFISSVKENFQLTYAASPQQNAMAAHFQTRDDYRVSKTIVDELYRLNDPRLPIFAQLPADTAVHVYVGAANGLSNGDAGNQGLNKTSKPGEYFLRDETPASLLTYAEVLFGLSEAVSRGFIAGSAEDYYKQAITASFNQFGVSDSVTIDGYLNQNTVKFDALNYKKSIGLQKWISFYGQGPDAFAEWRRLDYPTLLPGPGSVLNGSMPARFFFPGTEQSQNRISYSAAVANQGPDLLTTKLWYDVF